jgi:transcriptional regulator with XRE-family HTH domain
MFRSDYSLQGVPVNPRVATKVPPHRIYGTWAAKGAAGTLQSMPRKLTHYLRNERRRLGFTQADIAALLGAAWKTRVSRYEREPALPPLDAGLAYQAIFHKPLGEIFGGATAKIRAEVRERARGLLASSPVAHSPTALRRKRSLERIIA